MSLFPALSAQRLLLTWYWENRRDLPWRNTRDPYAILVSEVMLQQTRVATVVPYYRRFLEQFPTVEELAAAETDAVLALWSGLGYYRRARLLHQAAREVVAGGQGFPPSVEGLGQLPGIGRYTAAAVASIAFGERVAALDGNVERVLSRFLALGADPRSKVGRDELQKGALGLLDRDHPGDGNQALMELGATVCLPKNPRCGSCPLSTGCRGAELGDPERFPPRREKRATVRVRRLVAYVETDGKFLLVRRPDDSPLLAGTWELPWIDLEGQEEGSLEALLHRAYGGDWSLGAKVGQVRHAITYRSLEVEVRRAELRSHDQVAEGPTAGWFSAEGLGELPLSSLVHKVLGAVTGDD